MLLLRYRSHIQLTLIFYFIYICNGCALILLNGHLSHGYYVSPSESFKCKLPGGVLSRQVKITDSSSPSGETVTLKLDFGLLWRVDHLKIGKHKLAIIDTNNIKRKSLEDAKNLYFKDYLEKNLDIVEIEWEQYNFINGNEVLLLNTYLKWEDNEENRQLLFSIDNDYLNVIHHTQNISDKIEKITSNSLDVYKSCEF